MPFRRYYRTGYRPMGYGQRRGYYGMRNRYSRFPGARRYTTRRIRFGGRRF